MQLIHVCGHFKILLTLVYLYLCWSWFINVYNDSCHGTTYINLILIHMHDIDIKALRVSPG